MSSTTTECGQVRSWEIASNPLPPRVNASTKTLPSSRRFGVWPDREHVIEGGDANKKPRLIVPVLAHQRVYLMGMGKTVGIQLRGVSGRWALTQLRVEDAR